jgi:hypothetical protein
MSPPVSGSPRSTASRTHHLVPGKDEAAPPHRLRQPHEWPFTPVWSAPILLLQTFGASASVVPESRTVTTPARLTASLNQVYTSRHTGRDLARAGASTSSGGALARDPTTPRSRVGPASRGRMAAPAGDDADRLCSHSVTTPVELGLTASVPGRHLNMGETAVTRDPVSKIKTTRWWRSRRRAGTSWREDHILIPPVSRVFARSEEAHSCSRD